MIAGYVMVLLVFSSGHWEAIRPISTDIFPSYEVCMQSAALISAAPDEKIECGEVVR